VREVEVDESRVEVVGEARAARASSRIRRTEHQVVDEELRPPVEQLGERLLPLLGVERVLIAGAHA
jgi:hypothetical protein